MDDKNNLLKVELLGLLNKKSSKAGAILIFGDWGVGKTHFWNYEVAPQLKRTNLYMSLTGIKSIDEIYEKLMFAFIKKASIEEKSVEKMLELIKKSVKGVKEILPKLLKGVMDDYTNIPRHLSNLINVSCLIPEDCVVCFDDLERSDIEISALMGACIDLQENHKVQVVLISNKEKIENNRLEQFLLNKEKIVWKEFRYNGSINDVFEKFLIDIYPVVEVTPVDSDKETILDMFRKGPPNLRVLYRCIQDLGRIQSSLAQKMSKEYVEYFCALYFWSKSGNELIKFEDYEYSGYFSVNKENSDKMELEERNFFKTYFPNTWKVFSSEEIFNFIKTGLVDLTKLKQDIEPNKGTLGAALHSELKEGSWFFATDGKNLQYVTNILETLKRKEDPLKTGFGLAIHLWTICEHSKIDFPSDFENIFESFLKFRAGEEDREDIGSFHLDNEELSRFVEKWRKTFEEFDTQKIVNRWTRQFVTQVLSGVEINTRNVNIRGHETFVRVLTDTELLDAVESISETFPEVHYSFYTRARKAIAETFFEEPTSRDKYYKTLKDRLSKWQPKDRSSVKRKSILENQLQ